MSPNGREVARLGLAVPKRHIRRAVARNRIKRIVRESFRHHQALLCGLDIVVLARSGASGRTNRELHARLEQTWRKLAQQCKNFSSQ